MIGEITRHVQMYSLRDMYMCAHIVRMYIVWRDCDTFTVYEICTHVHIYACTVQCMERLREMYTFMVAGHVHIICLFVCIYDLQATIDTARCLLTLNYKVYLVVGSALPYCCSISEIERGPMVK